jgi:hypothetical protein
MVVDDHDDRVEFVPDIVAISVENRPHTAPPLLPDDVTAMRMWNVIEALCRGTELADAYHVTIAEEPPW